MKRNKARVLILALVMVLTTAISAYAADAPADVKDQKYETAVRILMEKGIVTGDVDGSFHPDDTLTRAQACIIIVKSMDPPTAEISATATQPAPKSGFRDMSGYSWAEGYISYAVKANITKGYPDGTFKPGNKVTTNELITMVSRAAGWSDETIGGTWPANYITKAQELQLLGNLPSPMPELATKWMAAQLDYNALDQIVAANHKTETPPQGTDKDTPDSIPDTSTMTYVSAKFNSTMTTFNGKPISKNVKIYTYGLEKDYSAAMTFSSKIADYREETVYKYKSVKTPAYYRVENDKIIEMVLPADVGFTGRAYSVINGTVQTVNGKEEKVNGLETLTAEREITWLAKNNLRGIPSVSEYFDGEVYELVLINGEIQSINKASDTDKADPAFNEISGNTSDFVTVTSKDGSIVYVTGGEIVLLKDNASVYMLENGKNSEYQDGTASSIKSGVQIRAYDMTDDDEQSADVVVVKD